MLINNIKWLENWYADNCDLKGINCKRIKIENIDNPGWNIYIDLRGTILEKMTLNWQEKYKTEDDWLFFKIENRIFEAVGGAKNLNEMLGIFRRGVETGTFLN